MPKIMKKPSSRRGYVKYLIKNAHLSTNEVSQLSGLTNSYLAKLTKDQIVSVKRDKLIFLSFALDLPLDEINELLNIYGYLEVSNQPDDVSLFLKAAERRKIVGMQPLFYNINFTLLLLKLYIMPGDLVVVNNRLLTSILQKVGAPFTEIYGISANDIYKEIEYACTSKRNYYLNILLKNNKLTYLMCQQCFDDYINDACIELEAEKKDFRVEHLKALISYIENQNYQFKLIDACPKFRFALKYIPKGKKYATHGQNKTFFVGHIKHQPKPTKKSDTQAKKSDTQAIYEKEIYGFASDSAKLFAHFDDEYNRLLKTHIVIDFPTKNDLVSYIREKAKKNKIFDDLDD
jgi:transcriptional regulator with XRE-family HTH domain